MTDNQTNLEILLIRHGTTKWSECSRHTSTTDLPLNEKGIKRAKQTCEFTKLNAPQATTDKRLTEWNHCHFDVKKRPRWSLIQTGPDSDETIQEICSRADSMNQSLSAMSEKTALFSSGHISRVIICRWLELPVESGERFLLDDGSPSVSTFKCGHRVLMMNNVVEIK